MIADQQILVTLARILSIIETRVQPEFYTVPEAADLLRCSDSKIRTLLRQGELPFVRISNSDKGTVLIKRKDINALIGL